MNTRIEHDTMGEIAVPAEHHWGAQTQRSLENFKIGGQRQPQEIITAFAYLKEACALANADCGKLTAEPDLHMRQWKVTKEQLWNAAKENTKRLLPAECFGMNFAVYELLSRSTPGEHDRENLLRRTWHIHEELELPEKDKMYVLSNKLKNYGAACIAYPYILDMLAGVLKENFYVLPSSVHEVIIVPESSQIRQSELERMVREINETQVPEEEILSNHAYFYYAQEGKLQLGKEMCIDREDNE